MRGFLPFKEIVPLFVPILFMLVSAATLNLLVYFYHIEQIRWSLGPIGTAAIIFSFAYSLRKRKIITFGSPKTLLRFHEILCWLGPLILLVHAGPRFNALLPWLAVAAMLVAVLSGVIGKSVLKKSQAHLNLQRQELKEQGNSSDTIQSELFWSSLVVDAMRSWRAVHTPITLLFAILSLLHIVTAQFLLTSGAMQ
jgi:hypothetical protein